MEERVETINQTTETPSKYEGLVGFWFGIGAAKMVHSIEELTSRKCQ